MSRLVQGRGRRPQGTVEPTVDATRHVDGGCRSLRSDARECECYIGKTAVDQQIIGPDFRASTRRHPASRDGAPAPQWMVQTSGQVE
jgi:hypothetical protein